ncbi:MAG: citramalate synthase [Proteobacteria bacterium]|nr:citramalate synthase [Pseudomonadota bacterium]
MKVFIYDTTLRDGTQGEGVNITVDSKLKLTKYLDNFGVKYIEGGWPGSNPKDAEYFQRVKEIPLHNAKVAAFGSTRKANSKCEDDSQIRALIEANTEVVTLVGKSSSLHVEKVLETSLDENLRMIEDSVSYFKNKDKEVIYDAEHFFDGFKLNKDYCLATLKAAVAGGVDWIVFCDTNGGTMPWEVSEIIKEAIFFLKKDAPELKTAFGIHTHNDAGLAIANALAAVKVGCTQIQGTINGIGERVGNCDLITTVANLKLKLSCECVSDQQLKKLTELSQIVDEAADLPANIRQPYVGKAAFAHKGGIHVAAILKIADSYQHIDPDLVGNEKRVLISELSGRGNLSYKLKELGLDGDKEEIRHVLDQIKELENQGHFFENADASIELLYLRGKKNYIKPFFIEDFSVLIEQRKGLDLKVVARVKLNIDNIVEQTAAEGEGPVNALDIAMRKILEAKYPALSKVKLTDYKVRILDGSISTAAITRVNVDFSDGNNIWTTMGASSDIIKASMQAIADSFELYCLKNC